jgi:2OG-Fe(II) oxygenase superfamily
VDGALVLDDAVAAADMRRLTDLAAMLDFEAQELGRGGFSSRQRAITDEPWISELVWRTVSPKVRDLGTFFADPTQRPNVDPPIECWKAYACNSVTRFYRYRAGAAFGRHVDEPWSPSPSQRSVLTVLLYLGSDDCGGGETAFDDEVVAAVPGRLVLFNHLKPHEGRMVESGTKITLRSDVLAVAP